MVISLLSDKNDTSAFAEMIRPETLTDGTEPEQRLIVCGISWERYLALDKALGIDRPVPRFYYLEGELEIMTTSTEHERIKKWIGDFLADYFIEAGLEIMPRGQATMRQVLPEAGAEPDESWCVGEEREFPDLVLEIALTSGGVNKLEIYRRFKVPEVWFWRGNKLEIFALGASGYEPVPRSRLLLELDVSLIERCVAIRSWREARHAFRAGLVRSK